MEICVHPTDKVSRPRRRILANGVESYYRQCTVCGQSVGGAVARARLPEWLKGRAAAEFDDALIVRYNTQLREAFAAERAEWFGWYDKYLQTDRWREKRRQVLERCGHLCEGCRIETATEVHHLSYDHVGDELLYELVGLCHDCHERAHTKSEQSRSRLIAVALATAENQA